MASAASQKMSREDFRKQKELEEARKAGTAPAEVDEEGRLVAAASPRPALFRPGMLCSLCLLPLGVKSAATGIWACAWVLANTHRWQRADAHVAC